jgi:hypothetical protein
LDLDHFPQIIVNCAGPTVGLMKVRGESEGNHLPKRGVGGSLRRQADLPGE